MTITLPSEIELRLVRQAARLGVNAPEYACRLIAEHLPQQDAPQSLSNLFDEWDAQDNTADPAELAHRIHEFEELKQSMNHSRNELEGYNSRTLWP